MSALAMPPTVPAEMPVVCSICGREYARKACKAEQVGEVSHGVCPVCWPAYEAQCEREMAAIERAERGGRW